MYSAFRMLETPRRCDKQNQTQLRNCISVDYLAMASCRGNIFRMTAPFYGKPSAWSVTGGCCRRATGSTSTHYLNQEWVIFSWRLGDKLKWNWIIIQLLRNKISLKNAVCKMAAILCRTQFVNERFCPKYLYVYGHSCMAHRILCKNRTKQKLCLYT